MWSIAERDLRAAALLVLIACGSREQPASHDPSVPEPATAADPVIALASGDGEVCATRASKRVVCWGGGSATREAKPLHVVPRLPAWDPPGRPPADVAAQTGGLHLRLRSDGGCALVAAGAVACWGELDQRSHRKLPLTRTTALGALDRVAPLGTDALCALRRDGAIACWPAKALVQILDGGSVEPRIIAGDAKDPWIDVVENCGLRRSGRVFCWGDNSRGQVTGVGDTRERPARLVDPARPRVFGSFDDDPWCAAIDDGSVVCWPAERPVLRLPAPGDGDRVVQIVPAIYGACALLHSGRVACWAQPWACVQARRRPARSAGIAASGAGASSANA